MKLFFILLGAFFSHIALSAALSDQDKSFFLKESTAKYHNSISKVKTNKDLQLTKGIEATDALYASLKINENTADAISQFSHYFNLDEQLGQVAAQELINAYKIQENCSSKRKRDVCPPTEFNAQNIKRLNDSKKADDILFDIDYMINYREEASQFIEIISHNEPLLLRLFQYTKQVKYLAPLTQGKNTDNSVLIKAALDSSHYEIHPINEIALDDFILKKNGENNFERKLEVQNSLIAKLFLNDLNTQAIDVIKEVSRNNLEAYANEKDNIFNCEKCTDISNELIAYQLVNGNFINASTLATLFPIKKIKQNRNLLETRQFLLNLMSPKISEKDLYSWMIYGNPTGKKSRAKSKDYDDYEHVGWLSSLSDASPIVRRAAYQYFEKMNYPEFARYMKENHRYHETRGEFPLAKGLGADYQNIVNHYEALIKTSNSIWAREQTTNTKDENYKFLLKVVEKELPLKYQNQNPVEPDFKTLPTPLPTREDNIIRAEKFNDEWYVIYVSSALDPTGEVPAPGYWLAKTTRHGKAWEIPVYMGMQMYFPYEIIPNAAMPMMSEAGIDLQANIKELDTNSITFPPVGLFFKKEKNNIVIHINPDDLFKDSDNDGLTDILEMKIGTNPKDPDTDKDGYVDSADTLPLTPFDKNSTAYNQLALLLLKKVVGIDEQAITVGVAKSSDDILTATGLNNIKAHPIIDSQKTLFLTGNKELFTGLDIPFRIIFVDEKLPVNTGYSLPTDIGWVFPNADRTEYYVIWSAHWAGGTFIIHVKNGKFKIEEVSQWIT